MNHDVRPEVRRAIYQLVEDAPAAHPFDELAHHRLPPRGPHRGRLLVTSCAVAVALVVGLFVATRSGFPAGSTAPTEAPSSTSTTDGATSTPTPTTPQPTTVPSTAPVTSTPNTAVDTLPRLLLTDPTATLTAGYVYQTGGSKEGCCFQQVFRSALDRVGPPALWLYDGESNVADSFAGAASTVDVAGKAAQVRAQSSGGDVVIEVLLHPAPGRRAFIVSLGLTNEEVLGVAAALRPRTAAGYDLAAALPRSLQLISEGTLGSLSLREQTQLYYDVAEGGKVTLLQFDSGREVLEETLSAALGGSRSIATVDVHGHEAIVLAQTTSAGEVSRVFWPESAGWVEVEMTGVPLENVPALLATVRSVPQAEYDRLVVRG